MLELTSPTRIPRPQEEEGDAGETKLSHLPLVESPLASLTARKAQKGMSLDLVVNVSDASLTPHSGELAENEDAQILTPVPHMDVGDMTPGGGLVVASALSRRQLDGPCSAGSVPDIQRNIVELFVSCPNFGSPSGGSPGSPPPE